MADMTPTGARSRIHSRVYGWLRLAASGVGNCRGDGRLATVSDDVSSAIDRATDFDERMMNHNFDVDWQAYADVQKGLSLLVELGHLADAKSLALKLMKDGSYQVECSDEGLMTDEISQCLKPVIRAVKAAGGDEAVKWAGDMQTADRVGFICDKELAELRGGS